MNRLLIVNTCKDKKYFREIYNNNIKEFHKRYVKLKINKNITPFDI